MQLDPTPQHNQGFRAAAAGLVLHIAHGKETVETLPWLQQLLRSVDVPELDEIRGAADRLALHFAEQQQQKMLEETHEA